MKRAYISTENAATAIGIAGVFDLLMAIRHPELPAYALIFIVSCVAVRGALSGVYFRGEMLTIVNPLRTVRVRWADVAGFSLGPWGPFALVAYVDMKDGRKIHVLGLSPPNPMTRPNNRTAQTTIAELNRAVEARDHTVATVA